jgi:hypothetical protein
MAITQSICSTFKSELLQGVHDFGSNAAYPPAGGDTFKLALYTSAATLSSATTVYTTSGETTGTGYTAGGATLTNLGVSLSGTTAYLSFDNYTWTTATISAAGALIYNASQGNKAVAVLSFGATYSSTAGNFTLTFPANTSTTAVIILN